MATNSTSKKGQCINFGNCSKASSKEIVEVNLGDDFNCPECEGSLVEVKTKKTPVWIFILIAVVLIGGGVGALFGLGIIGGETEEAPITITVDPTPEPEQPIEKPKEPEEVTPLYLEYISFGKESITLKEGETETLTWTHAPEGAVLDSLAWNSDEPAIATVENGLITALKPGKAIITLRDNQGNNARAHIDVIVEKAEEKKDPTSLTFSYGKYTGQIKNGKANGSGRLVFTKTHRISEYDKTQQRMAEPGDYVDGQFENNNFYSGKWFDKNGNQKGAIILQKLGL